VLKVENVRKKYGKFVALDNVSLEVMKGSHALMLGPNGAGKTTLIKCIMNLVSFEGRITVNGVDVRRQTRKAKSMIGYVPQHYRFYDNQSVLEHMQLSSNLKGVSKDEVHAKLDVVNLWQAKSKRVRELSSGMRQRLGIALALIGDPPLLVLDEPTSNVDLRGQFEFQSLLERLLGEGKTMLTTSHLSGLGDIATEAIIIDRGKIIANGPPNDLIAKMNVTDTIYVRVDGSDGAKAVELMKDAGVTEINTKGSWLVVSLAPSQKLAVVGSLIRAGTKVEDLVIERTTIESEYIKLLEDSKLS
jgi:ABC-type multidrug transport system ATPase subunit